jgi:hypothetical protein
LLLQLWRSVRDFLEQSRAWTEEPILDDDGYVLLNVEAVRQEVEDYAAKAYKAAKANKDVSARTQLLLTAQQMQACAHLPTLLQCIWQSCASTACQLRLAVVGFVCGSMAMHDLLCSALKGCPRSP